MYLHLKVNVMYIQSNCSTPPSGRVIYMHDHILSRKTEIELR